VKGPAHRHRLRGGPERRRPGIAWQVSLRIGLMMKLFDR